MPARAGYSPWSPYYADNTKIYKSGRAVNGDMEWDLSTGWHPKRNKGWIKNPGDGKTVKQHTIIGTDGKRYKIYRTEGFDDVIGFHSHGDALQKDADLLDYIESAFDDKVAPVAPIFATCKGGHIKTIEYSEQKLLLRVQFGGVNHLGKTSSADICVFFNVPPVVAFELIALAKGNHTDKDGKHIVGKTFWDLVRIRGQQFGARYPFEYQVKAASVKYGNRRIVDNGSSAYYIDKEKITDAVNKSNKISKYITEQDNDIVYYGNQGDLDDVYYDDFEDRLINKIENKDANQGMSSSDYAAYTVLGERDFKRYKELNDKVKNDRTNVLNERKEQAKENVLKDTDSLFDLSTDYVAKGLASLVTHNTSDSETENVMKSMIESAIRDSGSNLTYSELRRSIENEPGYDAFIMDKLEYEARRMDNPNAFKKNSFGDYELRPNVTQDKNYDSRVGLSMLSPAEKSELLGYRRRITSVINNSNQNYIDKHYKVNIWRPRDLDGMIEPSKWLTGNASRLPKEYATFKRLVENKDYENAMNILKKPNIGLAKHYDQFYEED